MAGGQASTGSAPVASGANNRVLEMARQIQELKATGKFTFQAGRYVAHFLSHY